MIFLVYTLYITVYTPMFYYKKQVPAIMVETCTLSGLFLAVALYLPRIFIWVIIALEGCHSYFANRLFLIIQLALNLRVDFTAVCIM